MADTPGHLGSEERQELLAEDTGLAAQWSVEEEEEASCERRRRDRERQLRAQDEDEGSLSPEQSEQEKLLSPQPSEAPELDEDEGFGDWSQKPEQQRQQQWGAGETPCYPIAT